MNYFQHPQSLVESEKIGKDTRIWAFAHILPGATIGADCNICDNVFIENDVIVGDRVTIKCGVQLWDGLVIEDDVFIGPNATFANDLFPRSKQQHPDTFVKTVIRMGASIGANATIMAGVTIGIRAIVRAGAVVTRDVPSFAIVEGNPSIVKGYVESGGVPANSRNMIKPSQLGGARESIVAGVKLFKLPFINDMRGNLSFAEYGQFLPFLPKRYFLVFDVPSKEVRGEHAHKNIHQFLVCVKGSVSLVVDDGLKREEMLLDAVDIGVYIPPMVWGIQYKYSQDAVLLVLASDVYDADDYIRDYDKFLDAVKKTT